MTITILVLTTLCISSVGTVTIDNFKQLHTDILNGYNKDVRPVDNHTDVLTVSVGITLISLVDLDEIEQSIILNAQFHFTWIDTSLQWDPALYNGAEEISLEQKRIWRPDIFITNSLDVRQNLGFSDMKTDVAADGRVSWLPGDIFKLSCSVDVTLFPFDTQECEIKISTWTSPSSAIVLIVRDSLVGFGDFLPNGLWNLIEISHEIDLTSGNQLPTARILYKLKRRPQYYIVNIIIPIILLSVVNILVFLLPADSGEKMGFSITILLAFVVFLTLLAGMLPITSLNTPYLTLYISTLIALSCLALVATVFVLHVHHMSEEKGVPVALKVLVRVTRCVVCRSNSTNRVASSRLPTPEDANGSEADAERRNKGQGQEKKYSNESDETRGPEEIKWTDVSNSLDIVFIFLFTLAAFISALVFLIIMTNHL